MSMIYVTKKYWSIFVDSEKIKEQIQKQKQDFLL